MNQEIINKLLSDARFSAAIVAAITTILTFFITLLTKNYIENRLLKSKLKTEHNFEQQKEIKKILAKNKVHLINACENLNHRFWNFAKNHDKGWLNIDGKYEDRHYYYFHSFIYRFLVVFAWIENIEKEIIWLDTTISSKDDLYLLKFLKVFPRVFCDLSLSTKENPNGDYAIDHFFRNDFNELPSVINKDGLIMSYTDFISNPEKDDTLKTIYYFFDGLNPNEDRERWDRLNLFSLLLIIFLNAYGYDFQKTSEAKMKQAINNPRMSKMLNGLIIALEDYKLTDHKEVKKFTKLIK